MEETPKKGRPVRVEYKLFNKQIQQVEQLTTTARFHCWGMRKTKGDPTKSVSETVGICELPNGRVRLIYPERITFLDLPTQKAES